MRAALALLLAAAVWPQAAQPVDPLIDAAATYVRAYQQQLTAVVADEAYVQEIKAQRPLDRGMPRKRRLKSEIFFMFAGPQDWLAIRDVVELEGHPVPDRQDLRASMSSISSPAVAHQLKKYSSRFNLGRVVRNFNEPTLGLLVLDDRHRGRFAFERLRTERGKGGELVTFRFTERRPPTLVWNLKLEPVFSSGQITIHAPTGRVVQTMLNINVEPVEMTLTTTYGENTRLGMWVPVRFGEHYRDGTATADSTPFEVIVCEARYANYRRFEVSTRIR